MDRFLRSSLIGAVIVAFEIGILIAADEPKKDSAEKLSQDARYVQRAKSQAGDEIAGAKDRADDAADRLKSIGKRRTTRADGTAVKPDKKLLAKQVKKAKEEYQELKSGRRLNPPKLSRPLEVGQIGYLPPNCNQKVKQVVNVTEAIVTLEFYTTSQEPGGRPNVIEVDVWMKGVDTSAMADDKRTDLDDVAFDVTGNKQYETVTGASRTLIVLERFDDSNAKTLLEAEAEKPDKKRAEPERKAPAKKKLKGEELGKE